ncbi:MAG: hypothetical protein K1X44_05360 [Alphaproteobacteria bacterium]|nr:hypothetical protein [Alphaproteobacteria bacterium]
MQTLKKLIDNQHKTNFNQFYDDRKNNQQNTFFDQTSLTRGYNGTAGNDVISGQYDEMNTINGFDGNDVLTGANLADILSGGKGNDWLYGNEGNNTLYGGDGDDYLIGGSGDEELHGDDGNDTIWAGSGNDRIETGNGSDSVFAGGGTDIISSSNLDDANDFIDGGDGNDTVILNIDQNTLWTRFYFTKIGSNEFALTSILTGEIDHYKNIEYFYTATDRKTIKISDILLSPDLSSSYLRQSMAGLSTNLSSESEFIKLENADTNIIQITNSKTF